jgi:putative transposase
MAKARRVKRCNNTQYGGMEASDIKKMEDLEDENRRLKQMFADLSLGNRALKDVIGKKL